MYLPVVAELLPMEINCDALYNCDNFIYFLNKIQIRFNLWHLWMYFEFELFI